MLEGLLGTAAEEAPAVLEWVVAQSGLSMLRDRVGDRILEVRQGRKARWLPPEESEPILHIHQYWREAATYDEVWQMGDEEIELALPYCDCARFGRSSSIPKGRLERSNRRMVYVDSSALKDLVRSRIGTMHEEGQPVPPCLDRCLSYLDTSLAHHLPFHLYQQG